MTGTCDLDLGNTILDLNRTFKSGQLFRWQKTADGWWEGVVEDRIVRVHQEGGMLSIEGADRDWAWRYFDLGLRLEDVYSAISCDPLVAAAVEWCRGLRIIRQPPWECLASFICATNTNIPRIRRCIELLCERFGEPVCDGKRYTFPEAEVLAEADDDKLQSCRLGYRARYLRETARTVADNPDWAERIAALPTTDARRELMRYPGVGPKVADCVLLFGSGRLEVFPVDVWIHRVVSRRFGVGGERLTPAAYEDIRRFAEGVFGRYAGYAQEYLYSYIRDQVPTFQLSR
ncbi:MAG: DNA-3-methyladenine glycosylase family protein [Methanoculleaceae archaeon]